MISAHFVLPDITGLPTGGNVYNQALEQALGRRAHTSRSRLDEDGGREGRAADVVLVDSLVASSTSVEKIKRWSGGKPLVLLAHYLNLVDPRRASDPRTEEDRRLLSEWSGIVATSAFAARCLAAEAFPEDRIVVARPGIDRDLVNAGVPEQHGGVADILTVASILPDKGLDDLLHALRILRALPWRWRLVGTDRLDPVFARAFLSRFQDELGGRGVYAGPLTGPALSEAYRSAHLFVLPTYFETCSMVTMEALACGLPVIATRVGGIPEQVTSDRQGLMVDPGDVQGLASTLEALLRDPKRRSAMGRAARERAAAYEGWESTAASVVGLLERIFRQRL